MLQTVQFKHGVKLQKTTKMTLKNQVSANKYKNYEDMIASHHYNISSEMKPRTVVKFHKTFFELKEECAKRFL